MFAVFVALLSLGALTSKVNALTSEVNALTSEVSKPQPITHEQRHQRELFNMQYRRKEIEYTRRGRKIAANSGPLEYLGNWHHGVIVEGATFFTQTQSYSVEVDGYVQPFCAPGGTGTRFYATCFSGTSGPTRGSGIVFPINAGNPTNFYVGTCEVIFDQNGVPFATLIDTWLDQDCQQPLNLGVNGTNVWTINLDLCYPEYGTNGVGGFASYTTSIVSGAKTTVPSLILGFLTALAVAYLIAPSR